MRGEHAGPSSKPVRPRPGPSGQIPAEDCGVSGDIRSVLPTASCHQNHGGGTEKVLPLRLSQSPAG